MNWAWYYMMNSGKGGMLYDQYPTPYNAVDQLCMDSAGGGRMPTSFGSLTEASYNLEAYIAELANEGPYSVAVDAGPDCWYYYSSGIITADMQCPDGLNHAVTVVAYTPAVYETSTGGDPVCNTTCVDPVGKGKSKSCPSTYPDEIYSRRGKLSRCCKTECSDGGDSTQTLVSPAYWTIQNSWGASWGNRGFMDIEITNGYGVVGINRRMQYVRV